ncbi:hypothetical protein ACHWQZ_G005318 [Mnemiopsis leidyi]
MCQSHPCKTKSTSIRVLEEAANCVTHGREEDLFNAWVYGVSLIVLFSVSTIYHCSCFTDKKNLIEYLRISDHATIYLFIAASYTPWLTIAGYDLVATHYVIPLWCLAVFGIFFSFYTKAKSQPGIELCMYVAEGVLPAVLMIHQVGYRPEFYDVAAGGFFFLSGIIFFKLDGTLPFAHAIWHIFVFLGTYYHSIALMELLAKNGNNFLHQGV